MMTWIAICVAIWAIGALVIAAIAGPGLSLEDGERCLFGLVALAWPIMLPPCAVILLLLAVRNLLVGHNETKRDLNEARFALDGLGYLYLWEANSISTKEAEKHFGTSEMSLDEIRHNAIRIIANSLKVEVPTDES